MGRKRRGQRKLPEQVRDFSIGVIQIMRSDGTVTNEPNITQEKLHPERRNLESSPFPMPLVMPRIVRG